MLLVGCALSAGVLAATIFNDRGDQGQAKTVTTVITGLAADVPVAPAGPRPRLPDGWRRVRDPQGGFSVGLPPGWSSKRTGGTLVLSSRDRTLAIAVGADRSAPGRVAEPRRYASEAIESLRGYRGLRATPARRLEQAPYPAAHATATGTYAQTGVKQAIRLVALQRRGDATFTMLAFRSAKTRATGVVDAVVGTIHAERPS